MSQAEASDITSSCSADAGGTTPATEASSSVAGDGFFTASSASLSVAGDGFFTASLAPLRSEEQILAKIEISKKQGWTELKRSIDGTALSDLTWENRVIWEQLKIQYPRFFKDSGRHFKEQFPQTFQDLGRHVKEFRQKYGQVRISKDRPEDMKTKVPEPEDMKTEVPEPEDMKEEVSEALKQLRDRLKILKQYQVVTRVFGDDRIFELGRKIAEGGQAEIYEVTCYSNPDCVAKVFKMKGFKLKKLQKLWPLATKKPSENSDFVEGGLVFAEPLRNCALIYYGTFLKDGRFAFIMDKYSGDLRDYINRKMMSSTYQGPPFSNYEAVRIMYDIACGVKELHDRGVLHKDLKAANVLVKLAKESGEIRKAIVADFESAALVVGTGFWMAPEVMEELQRKEELRKEGGGWTDDLNPDILTEKVDAYGFSMIYYEVLTGHIPFEGYVPSDRQRVIDGERPHLPEYVNDKTRALVERCWHKEPSKRPTFEDISNELAMV